MKDNIVAEIKSTLSHSETMMVIGLLSRLKHVTDFSAQDLLDIVYHWDTYAKRNRNDVVVAHIMGWTDETDPRELTEGQLLAEFSKMDARSFADESLTKGMHFMARASMASKDNEILAEHLNNHPLCDLFEDMSQAIATPFVIVNNFYYFSGFEESVKLSGKKFKIINMVCSALLCDLEK